MTEPAPPHGDPTHRPMPGAQLVALALGLAAWAGAILLIRWIVRL